MTDFSRERLDRLFSLDRPGVVWRHDVDFSPQCAAEMAYAEKQAGIRSTFYLMAGSEHYSPFSQVTRRAVHLILEYGHTIGVHVDLELPRDAETPSWLLKRRTLDDYRLLSTHYPVKRRVSFHAPPRDVYGKPVPGFDAAQGPLWKDCTVSDSRGVWHGDPEEALAGDGPLMLLLHPCWWFWPAHKAAIQRQIELAKP